MVFATVVFKGFEFPHLNYQIINQKKLKITLGKNNFNKKKILSLAFVDTHFRDTFHTSPIQPSSTFLWTRFMYYIFIYSFKHDPSPCDNMGEIEKVWFGGYGLVPFEPFA